MLTLLSILAYGIGLNLLIDIVLWTCPSSLGLVRSEFLIRLSLMSLLLRCTCNQLDQFLSIYSTLLLVLILLCNCINKILRDRVSRIVDTLHVVVDLEIECRFIDFDLLQNWPSQLFTSIRASITCLGMLWTMHMTILLIVSDLTSRSAHSSFHRIVIVSVEWLRPWMCIFWTFSVSISLASSLGINVKSNKLID